MKTNLAQLPVGRSCHYTGSKISKFEYSASVAWVVPIAVLMFYVIASLLGFVS